TAAITVLHQYPPTHNVLKDNYNPIKEQTVMNNHHNTSTAGAAQTESVLRNRHYPSTSASSSHSTTQLLTQEDQGLDGETRLEPTTAVEDKPHGSSTAILSSSTYKDSISSHSEGWASLQGEAGTIDSESLNAEAAGAAAATIPERGREEAPESVRASIGSTVTSTATSTTTATALPTTTTITPTESETTTLTPTPTPSPTTKPTDAASLAAGAGSDSESNGEFSCNICFDTSMSPVLTLCGHLFCWACLHQWLEAQHQNPTCPVCKAGCAQDKVIPIYGRGKEQLDPRSTTPKRPAGQRPEPFRNPNQTGFALGTGQVTFSGTMLPPFMFTPFGIQYGATYSGTIGGNGAVQTPMQAYVSRMFFMLGTLILVGILLY
ncbi:hypothetical protein BGZ97_009285, partial [Linnemannia gamsii]